MAWSYSCPFGVGGYSLGGKVWRIRVPKDSVIYGDNLVNKVLEFLGKAISVKLLLIEAKDRQDPCLHVLRDNMSAIGWLFRLSRIKKSSKYFRAVMMISREIAINVVEAGTQLLPQHIKGSLTSILDILSFAG